MSSVPIPGVFFPAGLPPLLLPGHRKAIFLDRDGVINVNHGYVHSADQTEWVSGIFELCRAGVEAGYSPVVVTNQAGIARGYYTEEEFLEYTRWVHGQFESRGVQIAATYYCPHHPEFGIGEFKVVCGCRKPQPGMILAAARDLSIDLSTSILVGDMPTDLEAAASAGVGTSFLVEGGLFELAKAVTDRGTKSRET